MSNKFNIIEQAHKRGLAGLELFDKYDKKDGLSGKVLLTIELPGDTIDESQAYGIAFARYLQFHGISATTITRI